MDLVGSFPESAFDFPYITFEVDFGKLPKFGGNSIQDLRVSLLAAAAVDLELAKSIPLIW